MTGAAGPGTDGVIEVLDDGRLARWTGEIDAAAVQDFRAGAPLVDELGPGLPTTVEVVDVTGAIFVDSSGLQLLARLVLAREQHDQRTTVRGARPFLTFLLEVTALLPRVDLVNPQQE